MINLFKRIRCWWSGHQFVYDWSVDPVMVTCERCPYAEKLYDAPINYGRAYGKAPTSVVPVDAHTSGELLPPRQDVEMRVDEILRVQNKDAFARVFNPVMGVGAPQRYDEVNRAVKRRKLRGRGLL